MQGDMILGFSTGCLYRTHERVSKETFSFFRSLGCNAIEITCRDEKDIEKLIAEIVPADLTGFDHVSLHAPTIFDPDIVELLQKANEIFHFKNIVVHPSEVESWNVLQRFELPYAAENMDWRKEIGKYAESMEDIFSKVDVSMILDLNHCFTNDPSMRLAKDMFEKFGKRISEIHLSGFEKLHEPLFRTKQIEIIEAIPDKSLPIIIESGCESEEEAKEEFEYVKAFLEREN